MDETIQAAVNLARANLRAEREIYAEKGNDMLQQFTYVLEEQCYFFLEKGCSLGIHIIFAVNQDLDKDLIVIDIDGPLYGTPYLPRRTWTLSRYSVKTIFGQSPNIDRIVSMFKDCLKQQYNAKDCGHHGWNYQISENEFCLKVKKRYEAHLQFLKDNDPAVLRKIHDEKKALERIKALAEYVKLLENRNSSFKSIIDHFIEWLIPQLKFMSHSHKSVRIILNMKQTKFQIVEADRYESEIGALKFSDVVTGLLQTYPDVISSNNYHQEGVFHNELKEELKKAMFSKFPTMISGFERYILSWEEKNNDPLHEELYRNFKHTIDLRESRYQASMDAYYRKVSSVVLHQMKNEELVKNDIIKVMKDLVVNFAINGHNLIKISTKYDFFSYASLDRTKYGTLYQLEFIPSISKEIIDASKESMFHNTCLDKVLKELLFPVIMTTIERSFSTGFTKIDEVTFQLSF
jgi:hypothetical protein